MASSALVACGGFLLAVLWMDLMFDVQVLRYRGAAEVPEPVLASIAAYYRRVTTTARPLGHLIALVMVTGLVLLVAEIARDPAHRGMRLVCLPLYAGPVLLGMLRVYPNAVRLGARTDAPARQGELARSICREHLLCFGGIFVFIALRLELA